MFPQHRLLHEEFNAFSKMAVNKTFLIIVAEVFLIGQTILTHFAQFPRVNTHRIGHFLQSSE